MKNRIVIAFFTLCVLVSCRGPVIHRKSPMDTFEKWGHLIQDTARALLPDSLISHFPPMNKDSLNLLSLSSSFIVGPYPNIVVEDRLPWVYGEEYAVVDSTYFITLQEAIASGFEKYYYSVDSLIINQISLHKDFIHFPPDSVILLPDLVFNDASASTKILDKGKGVVVDNSFLEESMNAPDQRYITGVSVLKDGNSIYYWIIIW